MISLYSNAVFLFLLLLVRHNDIKVLVSVCYKSAVLLLGSCCCHPCVVVCTGLGYCFTPLASSFT